ncbi:hypothetical protein PLESTB_000269000 [Pleodorina starrii]|uniref:CxC3 like cysteine cluster domain-containing protein n=1 Tax=Pleodorina starrii TaxID=330485 RepID=A0A9W6BDA0_9CHLO|nr:hypothetical protein PLESTM_000683700 [Pleodorina starrii]GLC49628.1 hypothetical protein PLESTB_000269000 [Pleodorina starrii]GLC65570.1 hypothetical protein PLESTF_000313900 [Pleodorina starrii]
MVKVTTYIQKAERRAKDRERARRKRQAAEQGARTTRPSRNDDGAYTVHPRAETGRFTRRTRNEEVPGADGWGGEEYQQQDFPEPERSPDAETGNPEERPTGEAYTLPEDLATAWLSDLDTALQFRSTRLAQQHKAFENAVEAAGMDCPQCGAQGRPHGVPIGVTVLLWSQPVCLRVQARWCPQCSAPYSPSPTAVDCLPDSQTGMRIHTSKDGSKLLWWIQTLLQLFDTLEFFTRHLSADRFCAALLDNWEKNEAQKPSSVSSSTLRKRFRRALLAYHYIEGLAEDFPETLPGWEGGALNGCPCCSDAAVADNGACGNGGEGAAGDGGGVVSGDASGGESGSGSDGGTEAVPAAAASPFLTRAAEGADGGSDGGVEAVPRPERAAGDGGADGGSGGGAEAGPGPERAADDGGADGGSDGGAEAVPRPERAAGDGGADGGSGGGAEAGPGPERAAGDGGADGGSDGGAEAVLRPERAAGDGGADGGSGGDAEAGPGPERAADDGGADGGSGGGVEAGPGPERAADDGGADGGSDGGAEAVPRPERAADDGGADGGSGGGAEAGPGPERAAGDGGVDGGSGGGAEAVPRPERAAGDGGADGGSGGDAEAGPGPERAADDGGADGGSGGGAEAGPGPERAAGDGGADGGSGGGAEAGPGPERAAGDGGDGSHEGSDRHGRADAAGSSGMQRARLQALAVGVHPVPPGTHPLWGLRLTGGVEDDGVGPKQLHSVHFDANFKVNLLARAGYSRHSPQLPRRRFFISNERVLAALGEPAASRDIGPTHCSNFNADRVLASDPQKNIITALGVALCRHGMLLRLVNLFGGERHAYCTSTVQSILQAGTGIRFMWYDIACRWGRSYEKWLVEQDDRLREVGAGMTYLIPPWHRYAHSFSCQKDFGHPTVPEVGRGTGEPAEVWNSVIGPHGSVLQYMSPANRESHVERTGRHYCRQAALGMAFRLWRMKARAEGALEAMTRQLSRLENALAAGSQQSVEQVRSRLQEKCEEEEQRRKRQLMPPPQGQGEQQRQAQAEQAARFVKGEYARCRLALDKLQRCDILDAETDAVSLGLLYPGADSASIRQRPVLIRSIRTRLEELESQHAINPADWVDGSEAFKSCLRRLLMKFLNFFPIRNIIVPVKPVPKEVSSGFALSVAAGLVHALLF